MHRQLLAASWSKAPLITGRRLLQIVETNSSLVVAVDRETFFGRVAVAKTWPHKLIITLEASTAVVVVVVDAAPAPEPAALPSSWTKCCHLRPLNVG